MKKIILFSMVSLFMSTGVFNSIYAVKQDQPSLASSLANSLYNNKYSVATTVALIVAPQIPMSKPIASLVMVSGLCAGYFLQYQIDQKKITDHTKKNVAKIASFLCLTAGLMGPAHLIKWLRTPYTLNVKNSLIVSLVNHYNVIKALLVGGGVFVLKDVVNRVGASSSKSEDDKPVTHKGKEDSKDGQ